MCMNQFVSCPIVYVIEYYQQTGPERRFLCVGMMYSVEGAAHPAVHFQTRGTSLPLMTRACCSLAPRTQTQAPIDAHHPSSTAARTQADRLQFYNDDKSHKHCQRHSDSKKHPLKIHPGHIASYLKHSPTPHLGPELPFRRLITVVITFAVPHLFQANKSQISLSLLMRSVLSCHAICAVSVLQYNSLFSNLQLCNLSCF